MKRTQVAIFAITSTVLLVVIAAGIMTVMNKQAKPSNEPSQTQSKPQTELEQKTYTKSEVATHDSSDDCWAIINQSVYDLTAYVNRHPGGDELLLACGQDATTLFESRRNEEGKQIGSGTPHSTGARSILETLKIGITKKD